MKNNNGPRTDPRGTPQLTTNVSEFADLIIIVYNLFPICDIILKPF